MKKVQLRTEKLDNRIFGTLYSTYQNNIVMISYQGILFNLYRLTDDILEKFFSSPDI